MALIKTIPNTTPMILKFLAIEGEASSVVPDITPGRVFGFCFCEHECDYQEPAFADPSDVSDSYKNDKGSVIYRTFAATDTVVINLIKDGVDIAVMNDATYGTFYDVGDLTAKPLYTGYQFEWEKIYSLHGSGVYQIRADATILGNALELFTNEFLLELYSEEAADKTVRIETFQNGNIESSEFDYTGLDWYQSIRIPGFFGNKQPEYTTENTLSGSRTIVQIQDSVRNLYTLTTNLINSRAANKMLYDHFLANKIFISDYNLFNFEIYDYFEVYPEEYGNSDYFSGSRKGKFEFVFTDKKQNILKRNF